MEALEKLNDLVDESDPDIDLPNIVHAFQTAEQIRRDHPDKEWFQLTGLIHDLGKVQGDSSKMGQTLRLSPCFTTVPLQIFFQITLITNAVVCLHW